MPPLRGDALPLSLRNAGEVVVASRATVASASLERVSPEACSDRVALGLSDLVMAIAGGLELAP